MKTMIRTYLLLLVLFPLPLLASPHPFQKDAPKALINISPKIEKNRDNEKKYATKDEVDLLKKDLAYAKELIRKFNESTDKIDSKIESTVASHIVANFSELIRTGLTVIALVIALLSFLGIPKIYDFIRNHIKKVYSEYEKKLEVREDELKVNISNKIKEHEENLETLHNELEGRGKEIEARVSNKIYVHLSHAFYLYYREFFKRPNHGGFKSGVSLATWFADGAIANVEKLPEGKEKDNRLKFAILHRAYHYASQSLSFKQGARASTPNQRIALNIAKELNGFIDNRYNSKMEQWINCKETIAWVYILLGDDKERSEGKHLVEGLVKHEGISQYSKKEIIDNYFQIKDLSRFKDDPYFPNFTEG